MFADTDAVRALGSANSMHADDLTQVAATLSSLTSASVAQAYGPVAARFISALVEAAAEGSRAIVALGDRLADSRRTAYTAADAYDAADHRAGTRLGW